MKFFAAALAMMATPVGASQGQHQSNMNPLEKQAMSAVEAACSRDVARYCTEGAQADPVSELLRSVGIAPIISFEPQQQQPDIPSILDQMMFTAIHMPMEMPQQETYYTVVEWPSFSIGLVTSTPDDRVEAPRDPSGSLLDQMVASLVEEPHIDPIDLSKTIMQKSQMILEKKDATEDYRRMARRLTHSQSGRQRNLMPLPFGCAKNRCLRSAYEQGIVSDACSDAMQTSESIHRTELARHALAVEQQKETFMSITVLYFALAFCTLFILHRRLRKHFQKMHEQRKLAESILIAVYNDPAVKAKVAESVQKDMGFVPPLPPHVLARKEHPPIWPLLFLMFKLAVSIVVIALAFTNPLLAMSILCCVMLFRCIMVSMGWCLPQFPSQDCTCCCCAASTEDLRLGKPLTEAQACCTCCNSTGVCPPTCKLCCGFDPDGGCGCCQDGCDCCSPKKKECTCCCCGLDSENAKKGILTKEQECCTCCAGTGSCPSTCKNCCGTDPDGSCDCCADGCDCCSPKKETVVYEAIQIV